MTLDGTAIPNEDGQNYYAGIASMTECQELCAGNDGKPHLRKRSRVIKNVRERYITQGTVDVGSNEVQAHFRKVRTDKHQ